MGATTIEPGAEGYVDISFTMTQGMEGPHHFLIVLDTNDPKHRRVELHIKADFVAG